jgi:hypothetical protein
MFFICSRARKVHAFFVGKQRPYTKLEIFVKVKVTLSLCLTKHQAVKVYGGLEVYLLAYLLHGAGHYLKS